MIVMKPCGKCGNDTTSGVIFNSGVYHCECGKCGFESSKSHDEGQAIKNWNRVYNNAHPSKKQPKVGHYWLVLDILINKKTIMLRDFDGWKAVGIDDVIPVEEVTPIKRVMTWQE